MNSGILSTSAVLLIGAFSAPINAASSNDSVEIVPIARYVSKEARLRSYDEFKAAVASGKAQYDSTFRHPFQPLGRLVVDCRNVKRVGVTLVLRVEDAHSGGIGHRYPTSISKDTTIKYVWSHSEHSETGGRYFSKYRVHPHRNMTMISDGLTLRDIDRVDGILTIDILVNAKTLYQTSFELVGCDNAT